MGQCRDKRIPVAVITPGETLHDFDGFVPAIRRPSIVGIGPEHIDPARVFFHERFEHNGSSAVEFPDFQDEQSPVPPSGLGRMGMTPSARQSYETTTSKEQQVSVEYFLGAFVESAWENSGRRVRA